MTKHLSQTKTGAALLTAILLSAIIGAAALGVNAIAIRQINISETYNNGLVAFYAANSGLEEGLVRYRFDKNVQIPTVINDTSDDLDRQPTNVYRNYLSDDPSPDHPYMRRELSDEGVPLASGYPFSDKLQVYDLAVFFQQRYFGQDMNGDNILSSIDLANLKYAESKPEFKINKDESKTLAISGSGDDNKIFLYWRWLKPCERTRPQALEIKVKVSNPLPLARDEFSALFSDPSCPGTNIANADTPTQLASNVFTPLIDNDLKTKMNISALEVSEISLRPIGSSAASGDGVVFGFAQGVNAGSPVNPTKTAGPTTTIKSLGYFSGASREIRAEIDRQSGTILDLFNFVIFKGGT